MVLIMQVFSQAKKSNVEVNLDISKLEDEKTVHQSNDFCNSLIADPETILTQAPPGLKEIKKSFQKIKSNSDDSTPLTNEELIAENQRLKAQIQEQLLHFPQYVQTQQFIKEKEFFK